jgi:Concanavalin A-like lectin/glucanases superfamily
MFIMKKKLYFFIITSALLITSSLSAQDITTGLKLHYTFDDGTATDASGNDLHGTLLGSAGIVVGKISNAVSMTVAEDYVLLPNNVTNGLTDYSVSAWVNVNTLNNWGRLFDFGSGTSTYMFFSPSNGGASRYAIKLNDTDGEQGINGPKITAGTWVHYAVTCAFNPQTGIGVGKLYVNGSLVGTNDAMTITPAALGATTQNYIGKSQYPDPTIDGAVDDFRIYSRALTTEEVLTLAGTPAELITQYSALSLPATPVVADLVLPTTMGSNGVSVSWTSSNPAIISNTGAVTRPAKLKAVVVLSAKLVLTTDTLTKTFNITVKPLVEGSELIAQWTFEPKNIKSDTGVVSITDVSESAYVATLKDVASIRTIGNANSNQFNVVDLGNNKGYIDLGTGIGEAIYLLSDYTMSAYFRVDESYALSGNGNWIWNFSNSDNIASTPTGYIFSSLNNQNLRITPNNWSKEDGINNNVSVPKGGWHHFAYSQKGTTGSTFLDGVLVKTGTVNALPATTMPMAGRTGTLYNWMGRSCYIVDPFLRQTLLYGFELYSVALTSDDFLESLDVDGKVAALDAAYVENPLYIATELTTEKDALIINGLSSVTSDIALPTQGSIDNGISISWKSSCPAILSTTGVVVSRPDFFDYNVTLTATLSKNAQIITKTMIATVKAKTGTEYTGDLIVNYDFAASNVDGRTVTDAAEKKFKGTLKNEAYIHLIGLDANQFNVMELGSDTGYFDMGTDLGKAIIGLTDYTMGAYFRIDETNTTLNNNGNFLWSISNSADAANAANGYIFGSVKNQSVQISNTHWGGEQNITLATNAPKGTWHHLAATHQDTLSILYIDGVAVDTVTIKLNPKTALIINNSTGTIYNWIGRPCFVGDNYLKKTLVYDFRIYKKALSAAEMTGITDKIASLDAAYLANPNALRTVKETAYRVYATNGTININGLTNEKVSLYDITGRQMKVLNASQIVVRPGLYIVKIDNSAVKVFVK